MNREEISANQQLITALRTEALALIMKYLWGMGYDREMVEQTVLRNFRVPVADAWWDMKEKQA